MIRTIITTNEITENSVIIQKLTSDNDEKPLSQK